MSLLFLIFFLSLSPIQQVTITCFEQMNFFFCHLIIRYLLYHINRLSVFFFLQIINLLMKRKRAIWFLFRISIYFLSPNTRSWEWGATPPLPPLHPVPLRPDADHRKKPQPKFWVTSKIRRWNKFRKDAFPNISTITHVYIHLDYEGCNLYKLKV